MAKDCKPDCKNYCKTKYEYRLLAPTKTVENIRDGFLKCLNCMVWLKLARTTKSCPCCRDRLRIKGRSVKIEKKRVD